MFVAHDQSGGRWIFTLIVLLVGGASRIVAAEETGQLKAVMIISNASEVDTDASDAVQGYLADLPVSLVVVSSGRLTSDLYTLEALAQEVADEHDAKVVFAADFAHQNRVLLYVSLPGVGTTLIRNIDCTDETVDSRFEAVAVIIRGILSAMVKGGEIGIHEPPPPPETTPEPAAEPPPPEKEADSASNTAKGTDSAAAQESDPRVDISTAYLLTILSDDVLMVHALRVSPTMYLGKWFRLFAAYRFTLPAVLKEQLLEIDIAPHPVELGLGFSKRWERIMFEGAAALVIDPMKCTSSPGMPGVTPAEGKITVRLGISPSLTVGLPITRRSLFFLAVSADIYFYQPVFKVRETADNTTRTVFKLWIASPGVHLGFRFTLM